jgi:hypothetical protein
LLASSQAIVSYCLQGHKQELCIFAFRRMYRLAGHSPDSKYTFFKFRFKLASKTYMFSTLLKYLSVVAGAMIKFILGPTIGFAQKLSVWETYACTVLGMLLAFGLVAGLGIPFRLFLLRNFAKDTKKFTPRKRMLVRVWKKYGLIGIAFLTPLLLTPMGGSLIAISFGEKPRKIFPFMVVSALFWGLVLSFAVYFAGDLLKL